MVASDGHLPAAVREDVLLLVTELVTNAVRHAAVGAEDSIRVELRRWPNRVLVEVVDAGAGFTRVRPRGRPDKSGGWGLVLVDRITADWGVVREPSRNCVWFEIEF